MSGTGKSASGAFAHLHQWCWQCAYRLSQVAIFDECQCNTRQSNADWAHSCSLRKLDKDKLMTMVQIGNASVVNTIEHCVAGAAHRVSLARSQSGCTRRHPCLLACLHVSVWPRATQCVTSRLSSARQLAPRRCRSWYKIFWCTSSLLLLSNTCMPTSESLMRLAWSSAGVDAGSGRSMQADNEHHACSAAAARPHDVLSTGRPVSFAAARLCFVASLSIHTLTAVKHGGAPC